MSSTILSAPKSEIMAPAGSFESLAAAINAGCDSVYFGVQHLNMRSRAASNFKITELQEVADRCREAGIKSYVTMNTLLYEHDMTLMRKIIDEAKRADIDSIIIQDIAAMLYAREVGMKVQASTQLSISNFESVKFFSQFADTCVLARELDLEMIKNICRRVREENICGPSGKLVRIEVFVHGALCIAQSGRCQMSLISTNTSAQRGACLQECRKEYRIFDEESGTELKVDNGYVMSPKDLCALPFLDKLVDAGISVFKIEGRGRAPEYVDTVVKVYREAVDAIDEGTFEQEKIEVWMERLKKVYNRGFSEGYYLGKPLPDWSGKSNSQATEEKTHVGLVTHYFDKAKVVEIKLQSGTIKVGDQLLITGRVTGVVHGKVNTMQNDGKVVSEALKADTITLPLEQKVRENDRVYIVTKRTDDHARY